MPRVHWMMCCQNAIVDRQSNNVSLINVMEQLNLPAQSLKQPLLGVPLHIAVLWEGEEQETFGQRIAWQTPAGTLHILHTGEEVTVEPRKRHRSILNLGGVVPPLEEFGTHHIVAQVRNNGGEWREVASVAIQIAEAPSGAPRQESATE